MKVPVDEFDGKVVYGEKRANAGKYLFFFLFFALVFLCLWLLIYDQVIM